MKLTEKQKEIVNKYIELANKLGHHPSRASLIEAGISRDKIKSRFGNFEKLQALILKEGTLSVPVEKPRTTPKVLLFDIETAPIVAYTWQIYDVNIGLNQIVEDWSVLSWSAKWLDSDTIMYKDLRATKNKRDDQKLLRDIWRLLDEADIVVTQNGKSFDVKKLNARFVIHGFQPPSSYRHIDTKLIAKKHFGFTSNSLEYMSKALNLPYKKKNHKKFPGQELWTECLKNNQEAWQEMEDYNKHDVLALEALYKRISPWDGNINFSVYSGITTCKCGNTQLIKNGYSYTNTSKFQRFKCKSCGTEFKDRTNLLKVKVKVGI
jgi:uncharacterized protein YprB with RNaseH-like and TPR domain